MNFNMFNGSLLSKTEIQSPYHELQSLWGSCGFQFCIPSHSTVTPGLQNPTQTLYPLKSTSWFFSHHIFWLCLKSFFAFYAWLILNSLFLPNLNCLHTEGSLTLSQSYICPLFAILHTWNHLLPSFLLYESHYRDCMWALYFIIYYRDYYIIFIKVYYVYIHNIYYRDCMSMYLKEMGIQDHLTYFL